MAAPVNPLRVEGLSRRFGGVQALQRVSLGVGPGERRAVLGPNGAGKSTLFQQISGMDRPTEGRILLFGEDVTRMPPHRRAALGLARTFQVPQLFPGLSLLKNLFLALQGLDAMKFSLLRPMSSFRRLLARAHGLLGDWQLADRRDVPVQELSHGEQRRVEILLAMAQQPRLLLLDEPTAGLSPPETAAVAGLIRALPRQVAILLIEHDMDVVFDLAETVTVLQSGRVVAEGSCDAVRSSALVQEIYLGRGAERSPGAEP